MSGSLEKKNKKPPVVVSFPWEGTNLTFPGPNGVVDGWWIFHRIINGDLYAFTFTSKEQAEKSDAWDMES